LSGNDGAGSGGGLASQRVSAGDRIMSPTRNANDDYTLPIGKRQ